VERGARQRGFSFRGFIKRFRSERAIKPYDFVRSSCRFKRVSLSSFFLALFPPPPAGNRVDIAALS